MKRQKLMMVDIQHNSNYLLPDFDDFAEFASTSEIPEFTEPEAPVAPGVTVPVTSFEIPAPLDPSQIPAEFGMISFTPVVEPEPTPTPPPGIRVSCYY